MYMTRLLDLARKEGAKSMNFAERLTRPRGTSGVGFPGDTIVMHRFPSRTGMHSGSRETRESNLLFEALTAPLYHRTVI